MSFNACSISTNGMTISIDSNNYTEYKKGNHDDDGAVFQHL